MNIKIFVKKLKNNFISLDLKIRRHDQLDV